jgi:hypothetical protein
MNADSLTAPALDAARAPAPRRAARAWPGAVAVRGAQAL